MRRLHLRQLQGSEAAERMGNSITENAMSMFRHEMNKQLLTVGLILFIFCIPTNSEIFLNKWAVHIEGGSVQADSIAASHGFKSLGQIGSLENYYLFEHHEVSRRAVTQSPHHHNRLHSDPQVNWVEQQKIHKRVKRDFITTNDIPTSAANDLPKFVDKMWESQWYLHGGAVGKFDMNILPAWQKGYSGKGVVVTILDDGIERNHTDLFANYDPRASWDINGNDNDPMPRYDNSDTNRHGTRCAGEVAAIANNTKCVVGAAFNAKIGGVRMLDGDVSDYVEAQSLSLNPQHVDIYSASWGPDDNGKVVDGPAKLAKEAFIQGVLKGRGGRGSLFVWASGNGGSQSDSCNCDGYTNSIFTLSISSASEKGTKPWYLEECSSTLATTYSSGQNYGEKKIVTTDLHDKCTDSHTGTSASAPLAAGICALALEANPSLTWRDMQYIVMMTARPEPLVDGEWIVNAVGRKVSHKYGYGMMDASALVDLAERWQTVPEQHICTSKVLILDKMVEGNGLEVSMDVNGCVGQPNRLLYMEHVQAKLTLSYSRRGDIKLNLISPSGTKSTLLPKRKNDYLEGQFKDWPFMSVHFWGEKPTGTWKLQVENTGSLLNRGKLLKWQLILYGVDEEPVRLKQPPRQRPVEPARQENADEDIIDLGDYDFGNFPVMHPLGEKQWRVDDGKKTEENSAGKHENSLLPKECDPECLYANGCSGPRPEDCEKCKTIRLSSKGPCVKNCPKGSFPEKDSGICQTCSRPCESCNDVGSQSCTSCASEYFLFEKSCLRNCPDGHYKDNDGHRCVKCSPFCKTCTSEINCQMCVSGYKNVENTCKPNCDLGHFSKSDGSCGKCVENCNFCKGEAQGDCIHCKKDESFQNGTCVSECQPGSYPEKISGGEQMCVSCDSECKTCDGPNAHDCTGCHSGFTLTQQSCLPQCNPDTYRDVSGGCSPCHPDCVSCSGPEKHDCSECLPPRLLLDGDCTEGCPRGFYFILERDTTQCYECDSSCSQCLGPSASDCYSCKTNHSLHEGSCLQKCPPQYYTYDGVCTPCHYSCLTCSGDGEKLCLTCRAGYTLTGGSCVQQHSDEEPRCPKGRYLESDTNRCEPCDTSCSTCQGSGPNNCLSCNHPLRFFQSHHRCVLCCSQTNTIGCCNCHPLTGVCMENRNINSEHMKWPEMDSMRSSNLLTENARSTWHQQETVYSDYMSPHAFTKRGLLAFAVLVCICSVVLFLVVFMLLQARSSERLCWGHRYEPIPAFYDIGRERVSLTKEDYADEDEIFSA